MKKHLALLAIAVALPTVTWAIDANCDFYQNLLPGTTYYVYNSEYPSYYVGPRSCRWYAKSSTNVKLTCSTFSLPVSNNCVGDRMAVSPSGDLQLADAHNYCGTGTFSLTSDGNYMNIVFTAYRGGTGRFLCTLEATAVTVPSCNCGWKKQSRIVGGTATGVNEYPMMAGLVNLELRHLFCGGVIISTKHVLTAAHCLDKMDRSKLAVLIGDHDISTGAETNASTIHLVSRIISHPSYSSDTGKNDIGVVTVADIIVFNMEVGPACLPFVQASTTFSGSQVEVLGWGGIVYGGPTSDVLQKVRLDVITLAQCQRTFPQVTNQQMCTYTKGKDACQFDSGGPVLWQNPNSMRLVSAGIVSYGQYCADDAPGVNTRVGAYLDWILSVTPGADYCHVE